MKWSISEEIWAILRSPVPNYSKLPNYFNVIKQQNYTNYTVDNPNPNPKPNHNLNPSPVVFNIKIRVVNG